MFIEVMNQLIFPGSSTLYHVFMESLSFSPLEISTAFLGSGARSVLVALWAIPDSATKKLMSRFYEHLIEGESASESLHQAMKWMRKNGLNQISEWASFTLIGDDVRLEFDKQR